MPGAPASRRTFALALTLLGSAVFGLGVALALLMLLFSPMMFDAPGASDQPYPWLIVASLALYPLLAIAGLIAAWRAFAREDYSATLRRLLIPLLAAGLVFAAFAALQIACAGNFACN